MENIKELWKAYMKSSELKFFVIKAEDFFEALSEEELTAFNNMLGVYTEFRKPKPVNEYYVVNKDDVPHLKTKEEFFKTIGYEIKNNGD